MNSEAQEDGGPSDFLAFGSSGNDDNRGYRNNFQYRPYNRNRNQRNQNFRRNQPFGGQDEGNPHFTPANFNGPGGYNKRFNDGFRGRPNHTNNFQNRRNFTPYNVSFQKVINLLPNVLSFMRIFIFRNSVEMLIRTQRFQFKIMSIKVW